MTAISATPWWGGGRAARIARAFRWPLAAAYVVAFVVSYRSKGFPFDRERVLLWALVALCIVSLGSSPRRFGQMVVDWIPFALLLLAYEYSRAFADNLGRPITVQLLVRADRSLFFGIDPVTWLQQRLYDPDAGPGWWELAVSIVYASHFVLPYVLAAVLWWRSRAVWRRWVNRFLLLSFAGVVTFAVLPTGAPWYASQQGYIGPLERPVGRGWRTIGFHAAPVLIERGRDVVNAFAAFPSLHAGHAFLAAAFVHQQRGWSRRWIWVYSYPMAMGFALVYGGEHFVVDVIAGFAFAGASMVAAGWLEAWWHARRATSEPVASAHMGDELARRQELAG
jgi:hypothetical protein